MATFKGIGYASGKYDTGATADTIEFNGSVDIAQNLNVQGDITSSSQQNLVVKDPAIDLGLGTETAQSTGFAFIANKGTNINTITSITASSRTVVCSASSSIPNNSIVQISGSSDPANDGLYVVSSGSGSANLVLDNTSYVGKAPFIQTAFNGDSTGGKISQVDLKAMLVAGQGLILDGGGSAIAEGTIVEKFASDALITNFTANGSYSALGTATTTLQEAYDNSSSPAKITTAGNKNIELELTAGNFEVQRGSVDFGSANALSTFNLDTSGAITIDSSGGGVSLQGASASDFTVAGANLALSTTTSGKIDISSAGAVGINDSSETGTIDIGNGSAGAITITSAGALNFTGEASSVLGVSGAQLQLLTQTSGEIDITSAGAVDVNAETTLALDSKDSTNLTMTANNGSNKTLLLSATNSGGGEGRINISSDAQVDITDGTGTLTLDGGALSEAGMSTVSLTPSAGITFTGGSASSYTTSAGALTLTSASACTWSTSAGVLTLGGADGVSIEEGGSNIIGISGGRAVTIENLTTLSITPSSTVDIDAGGAMTLDPTGGFTVGGDGTTGAINMLATSADIKFSAEGATNKCQVTSTFPQLVRQFVSNDAISLGDCVIFANNGGATNVVRTDANSATTADFCGVSLDNATASQNADIVVSGIVTITCTDTFGTGDIGKPVYLSGTAGRITKTPPSSAGDVVFKVGLCVFGSGNAWEIVLQPQFIMEIS